MGPCLACKKVAPLGFRYEHSGKVRYVWACAEHREQVLARWKEWKRKKETIG